MPTSSDSLVMYQKTLVIYAAMVVLGLLGAISDAILHQWAKTNRWHWLLAAYLAWLLVATCLGFVFRWGFFSFSSAVILFLMVNTIAALIIDILIYSLQIKMWSVLGILFAVASMVCIEYGRQ